MGKTNKQMEVLDESTRFMDDALKTASGPERAMMQLQYAEICDKLGDSDRFKENMDDAKDFFKKDADKGHPVAAFYMDLIHQRENGKPFPKPNEMQQRLNEFVEAHLDELRAKAGIQQPSGDPNLTSHEPETIELGDVEIAGPVASESANVSSEAVNKKANDIIAAMAAMAPKRPAPVTVSSEDEDVSTDSEDDEAASDTADDSSESDNTSES